jgi:hypothetical protein
MLGASVLQVSHELRILLTHRGTASDEQREWRVTKQALPSPRAHRHAQRGALHGAGRLACACKIVGSDAPPSARLSTAARARSAGAERELA